VRALLVLVVPDCPGAAAARFRSWTGAC